MFERFTDCSRRVVVLAQEHCRALDHDHIGTEHLLLALLSEQEGVAARALAAAGVTVQSVRDRVEAVRGRGPGTPPYVPFSPRTKKSLELGLRESLVLGHQRVGTEHLLLGMIREGEGVGVQVLRDLGVDLDELRQRVIDLAVAQSPEPSEERQRRRIESVSATVSTQAGAEPAAPPLCSHCASPLAEQLRARQLAARDDEGRVHEAVVLHCGVCGAALGVLPPPA